MKYEDALKRIKGADSVGGQLIAYRDGRNVLIGKSVQGTLIVEDDPEARGIVEEVSDKAVEEGREVMDVDDDRSPLSTHPSSATIHGTEPVPNISGDKQPVKGAGAIDEDAETRREALTPAKGSDPDAPHANVATKK
jgi:hypothetical protein